MRLTIFVLLALFVTPLKAELAVEWDLDSAKEILELLESTALDDARLLDAARLPGNQALIMKMAGMYPEASEALFAEAIRRAHAGETWREDPFQFWYVKRKHAELKAYLAGLLESRESLNVALASRLAPYVTDDLEVVATVRVVVGGVSAGWTANNGEFNVSLHHYLEDPPITMELGAAHELFHVVQEKLMPYVRSSLENEQRRNAEDFMIQLVREGTASLLDDPAQTELEGKMLSRDREIKKRNRERLPGTFLLLENVIFRVFHDSDADLHANYALGFLDGDVPAYTVGMYMAETIVAEDGHDGLVKLLQQTPASFTRRYAAIAEKSDRHPKLGAAFMAIANQLP